MKTYFSNTFNSVYTRTINITRSETYAKWCVILRTQYKQLLSSFNFTLSELDLINQINVAKIYTCLFVRISKFKIKLNASILLSIQRNKLYKRQQYVYTFWTYICLGHKISLIANVSNDNYKLNVGDVWRNSVNSV